MEQREYKILFLGPMGVGKSTAITAVSDIPPVHTEVANTETHLHSKTHTTAAMDYGECALPDGNVLRLYGSPGQERFSFMWPILAKGALGAIVLIDNSRPDPLADLDTYLSSILDHVPTSGIVIGLTRWETNPKPQLDDFMAQLQKQNLALPILPTDVRNKDDVLMLINVLLTGLEAALQRSEEMS